MNNEKYLLLNIDFPLKSFHSQNSDKKSIPYPMPTQIISAFLTTGRDNDTDFLNFLKALGTPVIIADTPRAKKRIALTNAIGRPNEK